MRAMVLFCILVLTGCAAVGPKFSSMPEVSDKSLVYVYRPEVFQNCGISPALMVDHDEKLLIKNKGYTYFYLEPGEHDFALQLSDRYNSVLPTQVTMQSGKVYYMKVFTSNEFTNQYAGFTVRRLFSIDLVENNIGEAEVSKCVYLDPSKSEKFSKSIFMSN